MTSAHYRRNSFRGWFGEVGYLYLIVVGSLVVLFAVGELVDVVRATSGRVPASVSARPHPEY